MYSFPQLQHAVKNINTTLKTKNRVLVSVPYYIGFESLSLYYYEKYNKKTLVLVDSDEQLDKIYSIVSQRLGEDTFLFFNKDPKSKILKNFTISSNKIFFNNFLKEGVPEKYLSFFDVVIVFEANHFVSNSNESSIKNIAKLSKKILGITNMVYRSDNISLKSYFKEIGYFYSINNAIKDNLLSKYILNNKDEVPDSNSDINNYVLQDIQRITNKNPEASIVVYLPTLKKCNELEEILREQGYAASSINSKMNSNTKRDIERYFIGYKYKILLNYAYVVGKKSFSVATDIIIGRHIFSPDAIYGILNSLLLKGDNKDKKLNIYDYYDSISMFNEIDFISSFESENKYDADEKLVQKRENNSDDKNVKEARETLAEREVSKKELELSKMFIEAHGIKKENKYYLSIGFGNKIIEINSVKKEDSEITNESEFYCNIYAYSKTKVKLLVSNPLKKENKKYNFFELEEVVKRNIEDTDRVKIDKMLELEISDRQYEIIDVVKSNGLINDSMVENISSMQQASSLISFGFFMAAKNNIELDIAPGKKKKAVLHADGIVSSSIKNTEQLIEEFRNGNVYVESKRHFVLLNELVKVLDGFDNNSGNVNIKINGSHRNIGNFKYKDYTKEETIDMFIFSIEMYIKGFFNEKDYK